MILAISVCVLLAVGNIDSRGQRMLRSTVLSLVYIILFGCFLLPVYADESRLRVGDKKSDFQCAVSKSNNGFEFLFKGQPKDDNAEYVLNRKELPEGLVEYAWIVFLENEERKVNFGLSYYKKRGPQRKISLHELFEQGQLALFVEKNGIEYLDPSFEKRIKIRKDNEGIVISLLNTHNDEFHLSEYEYANFWILPAGKMPMKCRDEILR